MEVKNNVEREREKKGVSLRSTTRFFRLYGGRAKKEKSS